MKPSKEVAETNAAFTKQRLDLLSGVKTETAHNKTINNLKSN